MLTRLPLSLMVELAVDCSTKYSVPSALTNSGGGFSSAIAGLAPRVGQRRRHVAQDAELHLILTSRCPALSRWTAGRRQLRPSSAF